MRAAIPLVLSMAVACKGGGDGGGDSTTELPTTGTTPAGTTSVPIQVSCDPQADNLLRFDCTAEVPVAENLFFLWGPEGANDQHSWPGRFATTHYMTMWGLAENSSYRLSAIGDSGQTSTSVTTGQLPAGWQAGSAVTGASDGSGFVHPLPCADVPTLVMTDVDGQTILYQELPGTELTSFEYTRDHTLLAVLDRDLLVEYDLFGNELLRMSAASGDFTGPIHRAHRGLFGLTWVMGVDLAFDATESYVVDNLVVLSLQQAVLAEWRLADNLTGPLDPTRDPGTSPWTSTWPDAIDYSQGSGLWVDDSGDVVVSFANLHTIFKLRANPQSTDFGSVVWRLSGGSHAAETTDLTITSTSGVSSTLDFERPMRVNLGSDGRLGVFDGRPTLPGDSRILMLDIDETGGTADIVEVFELGQDCGDGAAWTLPGGVRRLATCRDGGFAHEYEHGRNGTMWTMTPACTQPISNVQAIDIPWEISPSTN